MSSLKAKDGELITRSAHNLKGMAATVGAESLHQVAAAAEVRSRAGDWDAVERQVEQICAELDRCLGFVATLTSNLDQAAVKPETKPHGEATPCAS